MKVQELMSKSIQCCGPADSLEHAAEVMWSHDCGCIPVCAVGGASEAVGVLTDRDICMCALFQGKPLRELHVSDAMARQVVSVRPQDSIAAAQQAMRNARIRRLPVIDDRGTLVGMLSLSDIARDELRDRTGVGRHTSETELKDTLAAICQPNGSPLIA